MRVLRASIALYGVSLAACDNLLGLRDIVPDGEPVALSITASSTSVAGEPFRTLTVMVQDVQGKTVREFSGEISLALGDHPGGATLLGAPDATATDGVAHFDAVGIDAPGAGYTLIASTPGLPPATSGPIDITAPRFAPVVTGVAGGRIASVAVSPAMPGGTPIAFAAAGDGVYRSADGGARWKRASFGAHAAGHLIAAPGRPGVVYSWSSSSLKKTVDGGAVWRTLMAGHIGSVALDPRNPSVIYAAGIETRRSTDGGASWTNLDTPRCTLIAVDAVIADTVHCVTHDAIAQHAGVYRSSDGGETWTATKGLGSPFHIRMMIATPRGVFVEADGVLYRSIDADGSWVRVLASTFSSAMAYAPSMPDRIYLADVSGISVSSDGGASFGAPVNAGDFVVGLAVDPMNPDLVYAAGVRRGVLVSTDGGASWSPSSTGIDAHAVSSVAMAQGIPDILLMATARGALRTTDGGASWTTVSPVQANVHFDPVVSARAYLCGFIYFATSTDSGASFSGGNLASLGSPCNRLLVAGTTLFVTGAGRLLKSIDSGSRWADTGPGNGLHVMDAALGDAVGNVVVVATPDGIHRSSDGGASFQQVTVDFTPAIVADPRVPTRIIGGQCTGIRLSGDGGARFGAPAGDVCVHRLIGAGLALYAIGSTVSEVVLLTSTDGGSTWTPADTTGIPGGTGITSIAASEDNGTVYVGTTAGLYKTAAR